VLQSLSSGRTAGDRKLAAELTAFEDLKEDARWQLVERITSSSVFKRSTRLCLLLRHITERTLHGHENELTEQQIGRDAFQKSENYTTLDDSSVRVYARQLRLKLHEYFDSEGRTEELIVEIPKGTYTPAFRQIEVTAPANLAVESVVQSALLRRLLFSRTVPWIFCLGLACLCVAQIFLRGKSENLQKTVPWPLSAVFDGVHVSHIVVSDVNYDMLRIRNGKASSLNEYLRRGAGQDINLDHMDGPQTRLLSYVTGSTLTAFADVIAVTRLSNIASAHHINVLVQPAKSLQLRDLEDESGNYVFVGSSRSNLWATLFLNQLNFVEGGDSSGHQRAYFINLKPRPGEQKTYEGIQVGKEAGNGEDYADIALLPGVNGKGNILLLQGLHQEGTEAAGRFLGDETKLQELKNVFDAESSHLPIYFEALLKTEVRAGTSSEITIVAIRTIK
jgi:hypothetical protein